MVYVPVCLSPVCLYIYSFVKTYIHQKKDEYGGWPLPYGLNPYRYTAGGYCPILSVVGGYSLLMGCLVILRDIYIYDLHVVLFC